MVVVGGGGGRKKDVCQGRTRGQVEERLKKKKKG
jgi:hypothetical protein